VSGIMMIILINFILFWCNYPTTKIVKVASLNNGVSSSQSYITFDNINIQGFNVGFNLDNSNNAKVTNCEVDLLEDMEWF